jgi:hypothetical protein
MAKYTQDVFDSAFESVASTLQSMRLLYMELDDQEEEIAKQLEKISSEKESISQSAQGILNDFFAEFNSIELAESDCDFGGLYPDDWEPGSVSMPSPPRLGIEYND